MFNKFLLNFSFQDELIIDRTINSSNYEDLLSLHIELVEFTANELAGYYFSNYFDLKLHDKLYKPKKYNLSLAVFDTNNESFNFVFSYEKNEYAKDYILSSYERYSIGVEHFGYNNIPLRFGIQYASSPFKPYITSLSTVSFGSGFKLNSNLTLDYALDFKTINYMFPDLFPIQNENRADLDILNESETNFIITVNYDF